MKPSSNPAFAAPTGVDPTGESVANSGRPVLSGDAKTWQKITPRRMATMLILPPAILALSLIANGAKQANVRGTANQQNERELAKAMHKVPFEARLPRLAETNSKIVRVVLGEPDSQQGFQAYQLNVWYATNPASAYGPGEVFHVWQSNDKFLARNLRNPLAMPGKTVVIDGEPWHEVVDKRVPSNIVTTFSRRYDDGITLTVDSKSPQLAQDAIKAIDQAQKIGN